MNPRDKRTRRDNPVAEWYDGVGLGRFEGQPPTLQLVGPDMWIMHVSRVDAFRFVRASGEVIEPLYSFGTDGGSIPAIINGLPNLSPWHYGPGYLIHDWIWHTNRHGGPSHTFEESNIILAECIKSLIEVGYIHRNYSGSAGTCNMIFRAVQSSIARGIWDRAAGELSSTPPISS